MAAPSQHMGLRGVLTIPAQVRTEADKVKLAVAWGEQLLLQQHLQQQVRRDCRRHHTTKPGMAPRQRGPSLIRTSRLARARQLTACALADPIRLASPPAPPPLCSRRYPMSSAAQPPDPNPNCLSSRSPPALLPTVCNAQVQHNHVDLGHALETALLRRAALSVRSNGAARIARTAPAMGQQTSVRGDPNPHHPGATPTPTPTNQKR